MKIFAEELFSRFVRKLGERDVYLVGDAKDEIGPLLGSRLQGKSSPEDLPKLQERDMLILYDLLPDLKDIWRFFRALRCTVSSETTIFLTHLNYFWVPVRKIWRRILKGKIERESNWISHSDIVNLLHLNGFEVVSRERMILLPIHVPILSYLFNRVFLLFPLLRSLCFFHVYALRAVPNWERLHGEKKEHSVSVIVPCKDEKGNIERCVREIPFMGKKTEVIFVEGGSQDGTPEEIDRVIDAYKGPLEVRHITQATGPSKGGAVRDGFSQARGDILMILDADLTVEAEELRKFYLALSEGVGEFIMGSRLVYPLEKEAMRTLNIAGNKFFSFVFSWLLDQPIKDTLCGTKVLWKRDYEVIERNRSYFGDFDPFGDFDLIFGAALQRKKMIEIPIRYKRRAYGDTKISRFYHGWLLLRMCKVALFRFKLS